MTMNFGLNAAGASPAVWSGNSRREAEVEDAGFNPAHIIQASARLSPPRVDTVAFRIPKAEASTLAHPASIHAETAASGINWVSEAGRIGLSVGAGILGFAVAGPVGAALAGGLASGGYTAYTSRRDKGAIDYGQSAIDAGFGMIPGVGVGARVAGKLVGQGLRGTLQRGTAQGVVDGGIIGAAQGAVTNLYEGFKNKTFSAWQFAKDVAIGSVWGAGSGAAFGGGANLGLHLWNRRSAPQTATSPAAE